MKKKSIRISVDEDALNEAKFVFDTLGISLSDAVNVFLRQSVRENGFPFRIQINDPDPDRIIKLPDTE